MDLDLKQILKLNNRPRADKKIAVRLAGDFADLWDHAYKITGASNDSDCVRRMLQAVAVRNSLDASGNPVRVVVEHKDRAGHEKAEDLFVLLGYCKK